MSSKIRKAVEIVLAHISFFTIIPARSRIDVLEALRYVDFTALTVSLPITAVLALIYVVLRLVHMNAILACSLLYLSNIILTGFLHMDGVTDVIDALFAPPNKRHVILKDPHIGSLGACGLFTILSIGLVSSICTFSAFKTLKNLLLSELFSRLSCSACARMGKPLHKGLGSIVVEEAHRRRYLIIVPLAVTFFLSLVLCGFLKTLEFILSSLIITILLVYPVVRKLGGVSGDVLGYSIEVGRHVALIVLSIL